MFGFSTDWSINSRGPLAMKAEWRSYTPDGREVVVLRRGDAWHVRCGMSQARSTNLDVALTRAIRAEADSLTHAHEIDYPTWIRTVAATLEPES